MSTNLKERQQLAVQLLASGKTGREVAAELGVTPETVSRWRADVAFVAELNAMLNDASHNARQRLRNLVGDAVGVLEAVVRDSDAPIKSRLETAFKVLSLCGFASVGMGGGSENPEEIEAERLRQVALTSALAALDPFA